MQRRRSWLAIALATVVMAFSYFSFAGAFTQPGQTIDPSLVAVALVTAPFVFILLALVSRFPAPGRVAGAMALLLLLGLSIGLVSPALGAVAGFGAGGALTLRDPGYPGVMRNRWIAVVLVVGYVFILLLTITPAGVFTGALLPLMSLGFADEIAGWRANR